MLRAALSRSQVRLCAVQSLLGTFLAGGLLTVGGLGARFNAPATSSRLTTCVDETDLTSLS